MSQTQARGAGERELDTRGAGESELNTRGGGERELDTDKRSRGHEQDTRRAG
jgi:hypothetical protein